MTIYESDEDRRRETELRKELDKLWNVTIYKQGATTITDELKKVSTEINDGMVFGIRKVRDDDGKIVEKMLLLGYVEIRTRTIKSFTKETFMIDLKKLDDNLKKVEEHNRDKNKNRIEFILVVRWPDTTKWIRVTRELLNTVEKGIGGRTDRNDKNDTDEVVYIPIIDFTYLAGYGVDNIPEI